MALCELGGLATEGVHAVRGARARGPSAVNIIMAGCAERDNVAPASERDEQEHGGGHKRGKPSLFSPCLSSS